MTGVTYCHCIFTHLEVNMWPKHSQTRLPRRTGVSSVACLFTICLALLFALPAQAQLYTGSIAGIVQDPSGAIIPNSSVVLTDTDKGLTYNATTDASGRYVLRSLPPSTYSIKVDAAGFRPEVQKGIIITVNQNLTLNVSMQVGSASEAVEVTAQAPALSTEDAVTGQNLNR